MNSVTTNPNLIVIRHQEILEVRKYLNEGCLLEIGGGSGYQAMLLAEMGYHVTSVDVTIRSDAIFPIQPYDGIHLPGRDQEFGTIFSSNVLEHVQHLPELFGEMRRVLKDEGLAVHVMPSSVWRFWTTVARYPFLLKVALGLKKPGRGIASVADLPKAQRFIKILKRICFEPPHGEFKSAWQELVEFRGKRWKQRFESNGFEIVSQRGNELFYTGYSTFPKMSLKVRRHLARLFGSSCHVFVVRKSL